MIKLTSDQIAQLERVSVELGFFNARAMVAWVIDGILSRDDTYQRLKAQSGKPPSYHRSARPGSLRSRIEGLRRGTRFTASEIAVDGESVKSINVMLHSFARRGFIRLLSPAVRKPDGPGWESAVFVRR